MAAVLLRNLHTLWTTDVVRRRNSVRYDYILSIAADLGVNPHAWTATPFLVEGSDCEIVDGQNQLNAIIFAQAAKGKKKEATADAGASVTEATQARPPERVISPAVRSLLTRCATIANEAQLNTLRNTVRRSREDEANLAQQIVDRLNARAQAQRSIEAMTGVTPAVREAKLTSEIQKIVDAGFWADPRVKLDSRGQPTNDNQIWFVTAADVVLTNRETRDTVVTAEMGRYAMRLSLGEHPSVSVFGYRRNRMPAESRDGYLHPHIRPDGGICLGTAQVAVNDALVAETLSVVAELVGAILTGYNPSSPYVAIGAFTARENARLVPVFAGAGSSQAPHIPAKAWETDAYEAPYFEAERAAAEERRLAMEARRAAAAAARASSGAAPLTYTPIEIGTPGPEPTDLLPEGTELTYNGETWADVGTPFIRPGTQIGHYVVHETIVLRPPVTPSATTPAPTTV